MTAVEGSSWNVGYYVVNPPYVNSLNYWVDDYIGWTIDEVNTYRNYGVQFVTVDYTSFPCQYTVPQAMAIATRNGSGSRGTIYANSQVGDMPDMGNITTQRAGVYQQRSCSINTNTDPYTCQ